MSKGRSNLRPVLCAQELREEGLIRKLGPDLRRCVEYLHGPDDGLQVVLLLARRFHADAETVEGIKLYYQTLTERKAGAALFLAGSHTAEVP